MATTVQVSMAAETVIAGRVKRAVSGQDILQKKDGVILFLFQIHHVVGNSLFLKIAAKYQYRLVDRKLDVVVPC